MRHRRSLLKVLRGTLAASFLAALVSVGLVAQAGPAQAAAIAYTDDDYWHIGNWTTPFLTPNALFPDPATNPLDCGFMPLLKCAIDLFLPQDDGQDHAIGMPAAPKAGCDPSAPVGTGNACGSSSGSWGPTPQVTDSIATNKGVFALQISFDAVQSTWDISGTDVRTSGTSTAATGFTAYITCGNPTNGAWATTSIKYSFASRPMEAKSVGNGQCGPGLALAQVVTLPTVGLSPTIAPPVNYPSAVNENWVDKVTAATDYQVKLTCVVPAGDPDLTSDDITSTYTVNYSGVRGGFVYPSCKDRNPSSKTMGRDWYYKWPGETLFRQMMSNVFTDRSTWPKECYYDGCPLEVRYRGAPCQVGSVPCDNWIKGARLNPADYSCWWGPKQYGLSKCFKLERVYSAIPMRAIPENTDGDPDTGGPNPSGQNGGTTGGSTGGSTGAGVPSKVEVPVVSGNDAPGEDSGSCFPSGLAVLNPVEWVLRPLKCALSWAFVPSGDFFPDLSVDLSGAWQASTPGKWITAASGMTAGLSAAESGCWGPKFTLPGKFPVTIDLQEKLCSGALRTARDVLYNGASALIIVGGALTSVRLLGASVGYQASTR